MTLPRFLCYKLQQPSVRVIALHSESWHAQILSIFVTGMSVTRTMTGDRMIHSNGRCKSGKITYRLTEMSYKVLVAVNIENTAILSVTPCGSLLCFGQVSVYIFGVATVSLARCSA
jgi:hypothetical protein